MSRDDFKSLNELVDRFLSSSSGSFSELVELACSIRTSSVIGEEWIQERLPAETESLRRRALLASLACRPPLQVGWTYEVLLQELSSDDPSLVSEALDSLRLLQVDLSEMAERRLDDPDPHVRASALRLMFGRSAAISHYLRAAFADADYLVRETAIDLVDENPVEEFVPEIQRLLADGHPAVREAARAAVNHRTKHSNI